MRCATFRSRAARPFTGAMATGHAAAVVDYELTKTGLVLVAEEPGTFDGATRSRSDSEDACPIEAGRFLADSATHPLYIQFPDQTMQTIIASGEMTHQSGFGRGRWHTLFSDRPLHI